MARWKNVQWDLHGNERDKNVSTENVTTALLMDLRDELQKLNERFAALPCIPGLLRSIERQLKLQRRCPMHPRYSGRREPKTDCRPCWRFYRAVWK